MVYYRRITGETGRIPHAIHEASKSRHQARKAFDLLVVSFVLVKLEARSRRVSVQYTVLLVYVQ